ncbi:fimbrial protein [Serratia marcescens]|uniref:fimbrial protein n=1 Tax=Serratia marcescens TaxID=615 RepID=UPI0013769328|nr:fimbrial protein [Serratia marcescens]NCJ11725.1 fimbrial protein [Serratia marcescens]NDJ03222.1 fimbrial protein [Serratia marcescens]
MADFTGRLRPLLIGALLLGNGAAMASPPGEVQGTSGTVGFQGALLSSPCSLAPDSREQSVDLGEIGTLAFRRVGDQSVPVRFRLAFTHCLLGARALADNPAGMRNGDAGRLYLRGEQAATLVFLGESDPDNPQLLRLHGGVQGVGLRLKDQRGRALSLNQPGAPYVLQPGGNTLWFSAQLESTRPFIEANQFKGVVHVQLVYL